MRMSFRAISFALVLTAIVGGSASAQGIKIAYITSNVLLDQAPGRAEAEAQFDKETAVYREQIKRMSDSLNAMVQAFEKRQAGLSAALREAQQKEIQTKEASYQTRTRELQEKANQRQSELVGPILDRIKLAIEDVRVEGGFAFILNADGQASPIVAMDKNLNVTDRVLAKLRAAPAAPASKVPVPGAPAPTPSGVTRPVTPPPLD